MSTEFVVVIPARYGSTRLPGKPLLKLGGRPVIAHVWEKAIRSGATRVIVATDDPRIAEAVEGFQGEVYMTATDHPSGTDRLAEVAAKSSFDTNAIVVNLQGDEPLMPPALIKQVAETLAAQGAAAVATLAAPITDIDTMHDPHTVKLITDRQGRALYFSRAPIPWDRSGDTKTLLTCARRHLGLYAYRAGFLQRYQQLAPSVFEQLEQLEQLRMLAAGEWIQVADAVTEPGHGIDTSADLIAAETQIARGA